MATDDWQEQKYEKEFDATLSQIRRLREVDPKFNIESLRNMLETAYTHQGNNWTGRGAVGDVDQEAVIAAYQQALAEWERELEESSK